VVGSAQRLDQAAALTEAKASRTIKIYAAGVNRPGQSIVAQILGFYEYRLEMV
jgi:hypothetical protein